MSIETENTDSSNRKKPYNPDDYKVRTIFTIEPEDCLRINRAADEFMDKEIREGKILFSIG